MLLLEGLYPELKQSVCYLLYIEQICFGLDRHCEGDNKTPDDTPQSPTEAICIVICRRRLEKLAFY